MADISKLQVPIDGVMTEFNIKGSGGSANYYGTCTGQAANQTKAVTISSDQGFELKTGVLIFVKFDANNTYNATASNPVKLNVNSTGAKQIYAANTATPTGTAATYFGRTNYINQYIYNGTYWVWNGSSADNDTTYTPQALGFGYGTCSTAAATAAKVVTLSGYTLVTNGTVSVKFTNDVPANATMNINSKGAKNIWYQGANITDNIIKAGDFATFVYDGTRYQLTGIDREGSGLPDETITYEQFMAKTDEQQLAYTGYVTGWPDSGASVAGKWTNPVLCETGDTAVTITDSKILTSSAIDVYTQTTSGTEVPHSSVVVTAGQAVVTFSSALEEDAYVRLNILDTSSQNWTAAVSCDIGDTEATITDDNIYTTSIIKTYCEVASGVPIVPTSTEVTTGQVDLTFDALTEATNIKLLITNL